MAKDAYYFSHDSNARNDPKICMMRSVYGYQGYGWYWAIIEILREQQDFRLNMRSQYVWNAFALQLNCEGDTAQKFIQDCIDEFKLFQSDGEHFWSKSLLERMDKVKEKSEKAKASANARWSKKNDTNAMRTHSEGNAINEMKLNVRNTYGKYKNVFLSDEEYKKLIDVMAFENTTKMIEKMSWYKKEKKVQYENDCEVILQWNHKERTKKDECPYKG